MDLADLCHNINSHIKEFKKNNFALKNKF